MGTWDQFCGSTLAVNNPEHHWAHAFSMWHWHIPVHQQSQKAPPGLMHPSVCKTCENKCKEDGLAQQFEPFTGNLCIPKKHARGFARVFQQHNRTQENSRSNRELPGLPILHCDGRTRHLQAPQLCALYKNYNLRPMDTRQMV